MTRSRIADRCVGRRLTDRKRLPRLSAREPAFGAGLVAPAVISFWVHLAVYKPVTAPRMSRNHGYPVCAPSTDVPICVRVCHRERPHALILGVPELVFASERTGVP